MYMRKVFNKQNIEMFIGATPVCYWGSSSSKQGCADILLDVTCTFIKHPHVPTIII